MQARKDDQQQRLCEIDRLKEERKFLEAKIESLQESIKVEISVFLLFGRGCEFFRRDFESVSLSL